MEHCASMHRHVDGDVVRQGMLPGEQLVPLAIKRPTLEHDPCHGYFAFSTYAVPSFTRLMALSASSSTDTSRTLNVSVFRAAARSLVFTVPAFFTAASTLALSDSRSGVPTGKWNLPGSRFAAAFLAGTAFAFTFAGLAGAALPPLALAALAFTAAAAAAALSALLIPAPFVEGSSPKISDRSSGAAFLPIGASLTTKRAGHPAATHWSNRRLAAIRYL